MTPDYTDESLQLAITEAVYTSNVSLSTGQLLERLFGVNAHNNVSNTLKTFVRQHYTNQLKGFVRHFGKKHIYEQLKAGSTVFIKRFEQQESLDNLFDDNPLVQLRINCLVQEKSEGSLFTEFSRYFLRLRNRFVPLQAEETFRLTLIQWFQSGEMSKKIRSELTTWFQSTASLSEFKRKDFSAATARDPHKAKVINAVQQIKTDAFMQPENLKEILSKFLAPTVIKMEDGKVRLEGRTIFVSDWIDDITKKCPSNSDLDVEIYATDCCGIDCNIALYGVNLVISSNKVYIWGKHTVVLSGLGYAAGKSKAANAPNSSENGTNGVDGLPGFSSGNFHLNAKEMINPSWLSVYLNGGRGQDGGDGGDGYDGKDGAGVTQKDLDDLCVKYSSLYFNYWSTFQGYTPPKNWTQKSQKWDKSKQFGYEEYQDEHSRTIRYSYAGDVGYFYTTYHLYFMILGSLGTVGTQGGKNGVGGEGGYRGNSRAENPETGESFPINIERNMGQNGVNGVVGKSGRFGINGNDMVLIDRSVSGGAEKHYIGSATTELSTSYDYEAETMNRLNGLRKHDEPEKAACFAKFTTTDINKTERSAEAREAVTELTRASKAVAKKHVIAEQVLSRAAEFFQAENAFLADACKQTAVGRDLGEDEDEEKEATENVTEEVVMLRQRDESQVTKYTTESEKKTRSTITPRTLIQRIKAAGRFGTSGTAAQNIFDLLSIEIPASLLETVRFHTLFQKNHFYHSVTDIKLCLSLIAIQQDRLTDGKSFHDIVTIGKDVTVRRRQKYAFARLHADLENFVDQFENVRDVPNLSINAGADKLYGVKKVAYEVQPASVQKEIEDFFREFSKYRVPSDLLELFNNFYKNVDPKYVPLLQELNADVDWSDKNSFQPYFDKLQAWFTDEKKRKNIDSEYHTVPPPRNKTDLESRFENFAKILHKDRKEWAVLLDALRHHIKDNKELAARFGKVPNFKQEDGFRHQVTGFFSEKSIEDFIEPTLYVIRLYWLSLRILTYMRHLYNCNELLAIENEPLRRKDVYMDDGRLPSFDHFIHRARTQPLNVVSETCQLHMGKYGMGCASVRYLMSHKCDVNYQSYVETGYHELSKKENFNSAASKMNLIWVHEREIHGIEVDKDYRDLIQAQVAMSRRYSHRFTGDLAGESERDYRQSSDQQAFTSFYAKPFRSPIIQWIEGYLVLANDQKFLQHLHYRFGIDGCHLTPFELQFLLLSAAKLQTTHRCDIEFILLLCGSVSQGELVNVFLYMQIIYHQAHRFRDTRIYHGIQLIESAQHKALFAVKLNEHHESVDAGQIYKLILMLQHSSGGSEQLEKMTLYEWIDIANKQKWSEVGALMKKYGEVGYYLGFLDDRGRHEEQRRMCRVFDSVEYIPEILVAMISQSIANGEVNANDHYFSTLRSVLESGNSFPGLAINSEKRPCLITGESEQQKLIAFLAKQNPQKYEIILPSRERTIEDMINLVTGLHDATEEKELTRKQNTQRIGDMVKKVQERKDVRQRIDDLIKKVQESNKKNQTLTTESKRLLSEYESYIHEFKKINKTDPTLTESMRLLLEYDDYLHELHKIRLRPTQVMAVLYAVENETNVLEQVNTGEGKSYIIAAIAIIRRKLKYKYVDIITSSPVLAQRDADDMRSLYTKFQLSVGHNCDEDLEKRKKAYESDVVYGDIARFQRDYLLHTFYKKNVLGGRTRDAVVVDEVDNMLLDNGNNMLYLSHNVVGLNLLDSLLVFIQKQVYLPIFSGVKTDLESTRAQFDDKKIKQAVMRDIYGQITLEDLMTLKSHQMTKVTVDEAFNKLVKEEFIDADGYLTITNIKQLSTLDKHFASDKVFLIRLKNTFRIVLARQREIDLPKYLRDFVKLHLDEFIKNSKNAMFMKSDHEYVIDIDHTKSSSFVEPRVTIIDSNTGADLATSQWSGGLHQFLQIKHGCRLSPISLKAVFVSNVAYLKGYQKINGLSGTLGSVHESETLIELYKADLVKMPTFQPKRFYEHVPIIATSESDWLRSLFDEVCDQVCAQRSVLIICESIAQLRIVQTGLRSRYQQQIKPAKEVISCFESVTIYEREFNEFNFSVGSELKCSKLIIATNLAGRGTDIKLSRELVTARGLHVITAFLPLNCRIEEQAFGRVARCGQPGSAQIIATRATADDTQPSVFQLKMFRDNQEVHRLTSLQSFYDFHTETEEKCLEKFRNHCNQALSVVYSSKSANTPEALPTPAQVVYFALLDKWALWLERNAPLINNCATNRSEKEKEAIIASVDVFLKDHPIDGEKSCYEVAKKWIDFPQSLITLGIIQMSHDNGFQAAEETFDRILADGHEFAAEVYYFKACMRMRQWSQTRTTLDSIKIATPKDFPVDIEYAIEYFQKSRTLFTNRAQRRQREAKIVAQFLEGSGPNHIATCGFAVQHKSITSTYELIIANIDWILGIPCKPNMFDKENLPKAYTDDVYESLVRQGVISPVLISKYKYEDWQLNPLRNKFKLSKSDIAELINTIKNDVRSATFNNDTVLDVNIMTAHAKLSHRIGFWMQLKKLNVFLHAKEAKKEDKPLELEERIKHVLLVDQDLKDKLPAWMTELKPVPEPDLEALRYQIRLSNETNHGLMYNYSDTLATTDQNRMKEIEALVKSKVLQHDWIGQINVKVLRRIGYLDTFDGVTTTDIADFFEIDPISAAWIIDVLTENGVLKRDTMAMHRFTPDDKLWQDKVGIYANKDNKNESNQIAKHADDLIKIRDLAMLKNVTPGIIGHFCEVTDNDKLLAFYDLLKKEKLLERYLLTKFRLYGKLDCSCLPASIASEVDEFLSDRFAYSFALEHLCSALDNSIDDPTTPKKLFLQMNPQDEFHAELLNSGIGQQSRISQEDYEFLDITQYKYKDELLEIINTHRNKLWDQTQYHMELVPFGNYFTAQNYVVDSDTKAIVENGLRMVLSKRDDSIGWSLQNCVIDNSVKAAQGIWSGVKGVGNWFYSIGSSICQFVSPFVNACVDTFDYFVECGVAAGRAISRQVVAAVDAIAETEIVKMATQTIKDVAVAVSEPIVYAAKAVGNAAVAVGQPIVYAAKAVGNVAAAVAQPVVDAAKAAGSFVVDVADAAATAVGDAATAVGRYIADTKVFKQAKEAFNSAMNTAKNVYAKMSAYVTAATESYLYYNQCRVVARHLAIEQNGMVDEHFMIRNYDTALSKENRREVNDNVFEQKMRDYMVQWAESWLSQVKPVITTIVHAHFAKIPNIFSRADVETALESGPAISKLKNAATEHLSILANCTKVVFFQVIKHYAVQRDTNLATLSLAELGLSQTKHNFAQLAESIKMSCEEIQGTSDKYHPDALSSADLIKVVQEILQEKFKILVESVFVDPTIKLTSAFLESCRNRPQLATMAAFNTEDTAVKRAITNFNASTQHKKNAEFLLHELHQAVFNKLASDPDDKKLLQFAIKFGFPLPLAVAKPVAAAIQLVFAENGYGTGFVLRVFGDNADFVKDKPIQEFSTKEGGKMKANLRCVNGQLFICQTDFQKYSGSDNINALFFYESLLKTLGFVKKYFPKHEISFREAVIKKVLV